jgi:hypothetical protein
MPEDKKATAHTKNDVKIIVKFSVQRKGKKVGTPLDEANRDICDGLGSVILAYANVAFMVSGKFVRRIR